MSGFGPVASLPIAAVPSSGGGDNTSANAQLAGSGTFAPVSAQNQSAAFGGTGLFAPVSLQPTVNILVRAPYLTTDILGSQIAQTLTLSSAAIGSGVTATAGGGTPFNSGQADGTHYIQEAPPGTGLAKITAYTSATVVTVQNIGTFAGTSLASNGWSIFQPSCQPYEFISGTLTAHGSSITTGFWLSTYNIPNSWYVELALPSNYAFGDLGYLAVFPNINGTSRAVEVNRGPTSTPTTCKQVWIAPFRPSDTITTPGYQLQKIDGTNSGGHVTTGIQAIPGVTNGYAAEISWTPDVNDGVQFAGFWDGG